jgi:hypothetical protein
MRDNRTIANVLIDKRGYTAPKPKYPDVPCRECGVLFRQIRPWQVFCKDDCKKSWHANVLRRQLEEAEKEVSRLEREVIRLEAELAQRQSA